MATLFAPPSPDSLTGGATEGDMPQMPQFPPPYAVSTTTFSSASGTSSSTSIIVIIIIVASAVVVSALIYILLRFLSKRFHRSFRTFSAADDVVRRHDSLGLSSGRQQQCQAASVGLLDSLPIFTFGSVSGNLTGGDCAVCLSKFERHDKLRLLPLCCHAFHAECIDAWIVSNQSCPLCRSAVVASDSDLAGKIISGENPGVGTGSFGNGNSGSYRIEIGSISRRRGGSIEAVEGDRRAYSIGSFDYIVDENGYEVSVASITHRRGASDCTSVDKESSIGIPIPEPPGEAIAADVSTGRNWLREYVDRLASISISSRAISFRSSGRFFSGTGSSRRTEPSATVEDLEANHRVGEEISELFRWLSGI